eukprot:TRINITY_DN107293_c0_g1_i5.p1 TRINITY_DN107293_c0_g1~~TRINITY_DN107293_c0_g1_i5.p1  ORF type:complete len:279 (-),score=30.00 TRINITY_DN107293_c0_g1_i5:285-1121(-)
MGNAYSADQSEPYKFYPIQDNYKSLEDVNKALIRQGLESSKIILGIDFSQKNMQSLSEKETLHSLNDGQPNPYEEVLATLGRTMSKFNEDGLLHAYGFGDRNTEDKSVFPFIEDDVELEGFDKVIDRYRKLSPHVELYGPLSFAPLLLRATQLVRDSRYLYHILIIIASASFDPMLVEENKKALVHSSHFPLSIVFIGVGAGPWHGAEYMDNKVSHRIFDNFQFVDFSQLKKEQREKNWSQEEFDSQFALRVLMEIPDQYGLIQKHHLMNEEFHRQNT